MSSNTVSKQRKVNVRTPEVMERVQAEVESHYRSEIVEKIRNSGGLLQVGNTTVRLAKQFGFCYGVERAIDLAYAARKVFSDKKLHLIGEIIHNPEVNRQLFDMGVRFMPNPVPETTTMKQLQEQGCLVVDTTCGDVMSVWRRVRDYAKRGFTSIIHGKAKHEETRATASRALGEDGDGHYLIILTMDDCDYVCNFLTQGGDAQAFLQRFPGGYSPGFDPAVHLTKVGMANQTTMLKGETQEMERRLSQAITTRDGHKDNYTYFDTICGATQERQDALYDMLKSPMDMLLVVGGYNSSNTAHLVEIGEQELPTFFIRNSDCLESFEQIVHFDLHAKEEKTSYGKKFAPDQPIVIGITAGASCPNNLIADTIFRIFALREATAALESHLAA
jgi:4-hydroxy-3-methylbut-2-en-1-yl diphosphate reductase